MNPDKNFRLSKRAKTQIALLCKSNEDRSFYKSLMIQGELAEEAARRQSLKSKTPVLRNKDPLALVE
jgi:hypothetical protein